jgi:hypothetical protein
MSSASAQGLTHSTSAAADVRDVEASCALEVFTTTTNMLQSLAGQPLWTTARFSASDVIAIRQALRTSLQSLNQIESALDKRE